MITFLAFALAALLVYKLMNVVVQDPLEDTVFVAFVVIVMTLIFSPVVYLCCQKVIATDNYNIVPINENNYVYVQDYNYIIHYSSEATDNTIPVRGPNTLYIKPGIKPYVRIQKFWCPAWIAFGFKHVYVNIFVPDVKNICIDNRKGYIQSIYLKEEK